MGNPRQTIPNLPPAIGLAGPEQIWINQAGVDRRTTVAAIAAGSPVIGAGGVTVASYDALRHSALPATVATVTLVDPYKGGVFVRGAPHRDDGGLYINDTNGQTWVRTGWERVNAAWYYNCPQVTAGALTPVPADNGLPSVINSPDGTRTLGSPGLGPPEPDIMPASIPVHFLGDGTGVTITAADQAANPQWFGLPNFTPPGNNVPLGPYPVGTTWDYVALQECLYACFATRSAPGNIVWSNFSTGKTDNLPMWVPKGNMVTNQGLYAEMSGCDIYFATKAGSIITYNGGPSARPAVTFNAISYGSVHNLAVRAAAGCNPIVSLDYTGPQGSHGLAVQQLSLYDWVIVGGNIYDQLGVAIAYVGVGTAQGDTIVFVNPLILNCGLAGFYAGGFNALSIMVLEGDIQGCWHDGCQGMVGSFLLYGTSFQPQSAYFAQSYPQRFPVNVYGADVHYAGDGGPTTIRVMSDCRNEGNVMYIADSYVGGSIRNCAVAGANWINNWYTGVTGALGLILGTAPSLINTDVLLVDDGGPSWFNSGPSTTATVINNPSSPGWTPNQWAGRFVWLWWSNTFIEAHQIVSNDASNLTIATPFPAGMPLVGTPIKISGTGGTTQPNWDSFPAGQSFDGPLQSGGGFTTTVGSNVVQCARAAAGWVGQYAMVPAALKFTDGNGSGPFTGALIGKIGAVTPAVSFTLVDNQGHPVNAGVAFTDQFGYIGPAIPDGQLTWMPLDWDALSGPSQVDNTYIAKGRSRRLGDCRFMGGSAPFTTRFYRGFPDDPSDGRVSYSNSGDQGIPGPVNLMNGAFTLDLSTVVQARSFQFEVQGNSTLNLPAMGTMEARLRVFFETAVPAAVVTWGTNIRAVAPTLTLGSGGFATTVVDLVWNINPGTGVGAWFVLGIQGPM